MVGQLRGPRPRLGLIPGCGAYPPQLGLGVDEFRLRAPDVLGGVVEPASEVGCLVVEVVDLLALHLQCLDPLARHLQRLPDALQGTVLGVKEMIDRSPQVVAVLGRPDPVRDPQEFRPGGIGPEDRHRGLIGAASREGGRSTS